MRHSISAQRILKKRLEEVFSLEPNELGFYPLTYLYKKTTRYLKTMPLFYIIPLSILAAVVTYVLFGYLIVRFVNILQYGF